MCFGGFDGLIDGVNIGQQWDKLIMRDVVGRRIFEVKFPYIGLEFFVFLEFVAHYRISDIMRDHKRPHV